MTIPVLETAVVIGDTVTLTYNEALDATAHLSPSLFSIAVGHGAGGPFSVATAAVDALDPSKVVLTLNQAVSNGQFLTLSYNDPTNGVDDPNVIQDAAHPADDAADATIVVANNTPDTTAPSVAVSLNDSTLANGESAVVTFTFSEAPTGFTTEDVTTTNGASLSGFSITSDPRVYTAILTPHLSGAATVAVTDHGYTDAAGNAGSGGSATLTADLVGPTVAINAAHGTLAAGQSTTISFVFSEAPSGFDIADISATNGASISNFAATADPLVYTATLTAARAGSLSVSVADQSYTDAVGNPGAAGAETLTVSTQPDVTPVDGDDVINVLPGAGLVLGGGGNDLITGSTGDDYLQGNTGNDTIAGGVGADTILGGRDDDQLQGNTGSDTISGNLGNDTVHGGQDNDLVHGNEGDDYVFGDLGDDTVRGGQGADHLFGGDGNDMLFGDLGSDTLTGGAGADRFMFPLGAQGQDLITDFSQAEGDKIVIGANFAADFASLSSHIGADANGDAVITLDNLTITVAGVSPSSLAAGDFLFV